MKNKIEGSTKGLKTDQIRRLNNLFRRRIPPEFVVTPEVAEELFLLSTEIRRQIGLLINRQGRVVEVLAGDDKRVIIPVLTQYRTGTDRLRGLKCIHTHLDSSPLSRDDLTDLALLQLDFMAVVAGADHSQAYQVYAAHILPGEASPDSPGSPHIPEAAGLPCKLLKSLGPDELDINCRSMIAALEEELGQALALRQTSSRQERAVLVSVTTSAPAKARESLSELSSLAVAADLKVVETVLQQRKKIDHKFVMGRGKLSDLVIFCLQKAVNLVIFDQELSPAQIRSLADQVELKVIDRTQLILDIFAQRASSREGRLQVELAQLKYLQPRLAGKNSALSRLAGGIGGRGPGETKLEVDRRHIRNKINRLEKSLKAVKKQRRQQKSKRSKKGLPVVSIVGYTNAGKSTLLNTLTKSKVKAKDCLFMTLDPTSRRLKIPQDKEIIITDTVGFIRDLPQELFAAFAATLEELAAADLFLHVVDISNDQYRAQIEAVERILKKLGLERTPVIYVLNKQDRVNSDKIQSLVQSTGGLAVSATKAATLKPLLTELQKKISSW